MSVTIIFRVVNIIFILFPIGDSFFLRFFISLFKLVNDCGFNDVTDSILFSKSFNSLGRNLTTASFSIISSIIVFFICSNVGLVIPSIAFFKLSNPNKLSLFSMALLIDALISPFISTFVITTDIFFNIVSGSCCKINILFIFFPNSCK